MQNDSSTQTTASASGTESLTKELANQIRNARAAYNVKFQEQNTIMGEYTRLISTGSMAQLLVIEEKFHAVEAEAKALATRLFALQDRHIAALQAKFGLVTCNKRSSGCK
jgi:hypothetical protein